jgi:hypothetical protein
LAFPEGNAVGAFDAQAMGHQIPTFAKAELWAEGVLDLA